MDGEMQSFEHHEDRFIGFIVRAVPEEQTRFAKQRYAIFYEITHCV